MQSWSKTMAALVYFEFDEALLKNHVCDTV